MQREEVGRGRDAPVRVARAALLANGPLLPAADLPDAGQAGRGPCPPAHARGLQELPAGRGERAGHAAGEQEAGGRGGPNLVESAGSGGELRTLLRESANFQLRCGNWAASCEVLERMRAMEPSNFIILSRLINIYSKFDGERANR